MKDNKTLERIEHYLAGVLKDREHDDFEKQMQTDPDLAGQVNDYKMAVKSIEIFGRNELKNKLRKIHREEIKPGAAFGRRELLKLAAVFIGLLIVSGPFLYNYFYGAPDYQQLFEENFNNYPDILSQRGESYPDHLMLDEAMSYYKNKDFVNASVLFEALDKDDLPADDAIQFYSGISFLGAGNPEKASMILRSIATNNENPFREQARWYLALSFLSQEKPEEARILLEDIAKNKSWNHVKANQLLKELE